LSERKLRIGVSGLGRGFMLMLPTFTSHPKATLVAAVDPRAEARTRFEADFGGRAYGDFAALCTDPNIDLIYVASPHQFHAEQAIAAAHAGKGVLVEKPMALSLEECRAMTDATRVNDVPLIVGPSHAFDAPVACASRLIATGAYGPVRMITALNFTDYLYRPRRSEELSSAQGGGVVFGQAVHQVDVVRQLAGSAVRSVRAQAGVWDAARPVDGAYTAFLSFESGAVASLTYSGYGHFDSDALCDWVGETGSRRNPDDHGAARRRLQNLDAAAEAELRSDRGYGRAQTAAAAPAAFHEHFGFIVVSCEHADLQLRPWGVLVHGNTERVRHELPTPMVPRREAIDECYEAVVNGVAPLHDGNWGIATMEVCIALLRSSQERREIELTEDGL
jgi:phthalate 4,5-cis-dihydrodiol dehydrogenase